MNATLFNKALQINGPKIFSFMDFRMTPQPVTHSWMTIAPDATTSSNTRIHFQRALTSRNVKLLPQDVPVWLFLDWLTEQELLLHGSPKGDLECLQPQDKAYGQPDAFSNDTGVYATSDALWSMMYALRGKKAVGQKDMCLRFRTETGWSEPRYYFALAPAGGHDVSARELMDDGWVYIVESAGFKPSPPYKHGGFGWVKEAHSVNPCPVPPLMRVPVTTQDFPLPVDVYDPEETKKRALAEPWGFPWLDATDESQGM